MVTFLCIFILLQAVVSFLKVYYLNFLAKHYANNIQKIEILQTVKQHNECMKENNILNGKLFHILPAKLKPSLLIKLIKRLFMKTKITKQILFIAAGIVVVGVVGIWNPTAQRLLGMLAFGWMLADIARDVFPEKK